MNLSRRQFLAHTALVSASATTAALFASSGSAGALPAGGYGPLVTDPNGIIDLPAGFTYRVLASVNTIGAVPATKLGMRNASFPNGDGIDVVPGANLGILPGDPDAMGSFFEVATGRTYLVVNHEVSASESTKAVARTYKGVTTPIYDPAATAYGGCSVIVLDAAMNVIEHRPAITGTLTNCAGGMTPWGTWLTCEETTSVPAGGLPHGYVFEVDPLGVLTNGHAIKHGGRCPHEAAAINPATGEMYTTEDNGSNALIYRMVPVDATPAYGKLELGGSMSAMRVPGYDNFAQIVTNAVIPGVTWVDIPNPGGAAVPQDVTNLNTQWPATGSVTRGTKLEGCWWKDGKLWIASATSSLSGFSHQGQVFCYDPTAGTIQMVLRIPAAGLPVTQGAQTNVFGSPDNIAATPYGGAVFSEDGGDPNHLAMVDASGNAFAVARNPGGGEFAGGHFSPDGSWLFANMQSRQLTVAITGPWSPTPPAEVPEVGLNVLLPVTGVAMAAGLLAIRQRRMNELAR